MASSNPDRRVEEEEEAAAADDEDTGAQVAPIVRLEEVAVTTGEEDEEAILDLKSKLYRFDKDGNQWKERGVGSVKLLKHKESGKVRLVMRQSKTLKICANHLVLPTMTVQEHTGSDKSCVWHATDFADGELKDELFCIRFGSVENCKAFMKLVQEVAESQGNNEENNEENNEHNEENNEENNEEHNEENEVTATAGLLENLSVGDSNTEENATKEVHVEAKEEKKDSESEQGKPQAEKKEEASSSAT